MRKCRKCAIFGLGFPVAENYENVLLMKQYNETNVEVIGVSENYVKRIRYLSKAGTEIVARPKPVE